MKSGFVVLGSKNDPPPYETKQSPKDKETNKHPDRGIKKNQKDQEAGRCARSAEPIPQIKKKKKVMHAGVLQVK